MFLTCTNLKNIYMYLVCAVLQYIHNEVKLLQMLCMYMLAALKFIWSRICEGAISFKLPS